MGTTTKVCVVFSSFFSFSLFFSLLRSRNSILQTPRERAFAKFYFANALSRGVLEILFCEPALARRSQNGGLARGRSRGVRKMEVLRGGARAAFVKWRFCAGAFANSRTPAQS